MCNHALMGILSNIFGRKETDATAQLCAPYYKTITETAPIFTSFNGAIYEQELTRAAIERFAQACGKLKPECVGAGGSSIERVVKTRPNSLMTWSTFLSRLATIYEIDDTAFVVPTFKRDMQTINGFMPYKCETAELCEYKGEPWLIFHDATGETFAIEYKFVCVLTKFQYQSDIFGAPNCLNATMNLINAQVQAQESAIKNGAKIRFIGSLTGMVQEKDMEEKRKRFVESNFTSENTGGLLLYDSTFQNLQQIDPSAYTMDAGEMERIEENVYTYFGTNKNILQNSYSEEQWGAYYEGRIEPFAIRLSEGLTSVCFTDVEQAHGKRIEFSSNRLQYATLTSKRTMIKDMLDRGLLSINDAREILQLPPVEGGDARVIRGEYVDATDANNLVKGAKNATGDADSTTDDKDTNQTQETQQEG